MPSARGRRTDEDQLSRPFQRQGPRPERELLRRDQGLSSETEGKAQGSIARTSGDADEGPTEPSYPPPGRAAPASPSIRP